MIIDVNVYLSRWPFRRLLDDEPERLAARLRRHGVTQAWAGSFDGVFHKDVSAVNARLAADCRRVGGGLFAPFGSVNPKLPGWQEDLRRCDEEFRMPGIRLHPNYHGYTLDDPLFAELLSMAAARRLVVQIAVQMEDDRMQHHLMKVPPVDLTPLPKVARGVKSPVVLLNALRSLDRPKLKLLADTDVRYDIAMLEFVGGVARLAAEIPGRVLFGSHAPFYIFESAFLKMKEAALPEAEAARIFAGNAKELLRR